MLTFLAAVVCALLGWATAEVVRSPNASSREDRTEVESTNALGSAAGRLVRVRSAHYDGNKEALLGRKTRRLWPARDEVERQGKARKVHTNRISRRDLIERLQAHRFWKNEGLDD